MRVAQALRGSCTADRELKQHVQGESGAGPRWDLWVRRSNGAIGIDGNDNVMNHEREGITRRDDVCWMAFYFLSGHEAKDEMKRAPSALARQSGFRGILRSSLWDGSGRVVRGFAVSPRRLG